MEATPAWKKLFKYSPENYDFELHEKGLKVLNNVSATTFKKC